MTDSTMRQAFEKYAREDREQRDGRIAALDAELMLMHLRVQLQTERMGHAMLYLMFNPAPTPEGYAAILGAT